MIEPALTPGAGPGATIAAPPVTDTAPGPSGHQRGASGSESSSEGQGRPCPVCWRPVTPGSGQVPKVYHPECKDLGNFLAAAERSLHRVEFASDTAAAAMRRQLFGLANQIPPRGWDRERDARGCFLPAKPKTRSRKR